MKTKKKLMALCGVAIASVVAFGALATGCAGNIDTGDENIQVAQDQIAQIQQRYDEKGVVYEYTGAPVTLTMSHWDSDGASIERAVLDVLLGAFNNRYPSIQVSLEIIPDYETTYSTRFATHDVHDVFLVSDGVFTNWVKGSQQTMVNLSPYIAASNLVNMDDMFESVVTRYQYDPSSGLTGQGNQMTMPRDISSHVLYYNKDLFRELGIELPPSDRVMTMDEATAMWEALTKDLDGDGSIDVYGVAGLMPEGLVWSAGGDFLNDDRTAFPTEQTDLNALNKAYQYFQDAYYTYADGHGITPPSTVTQTGDPTALFAQEMVATVIAGSWEVATIQGNSFDWDIAYVPAFEESPEKNAWSGSISYAIYSGIASEKMEAAWKLVEYIGSPEGQEILAATGFQFPIYKSVAFSQEYLSQYANAKPSNYEIFLRSASEQPAGTWTYLTSDQWKELGYDGLSARLLDVNAEKRWTVQQFLDECKKTINQIV